MTNPVAAYLDLDLMLIHFTTELTPEEEAEYEEVRKRLRHDMFGKFRDMEPEEMPVPPPTRQAVWPGPGPVAKPKTEPKPRKMLTLTAMAIKALVDAGQTVREIAEERGYNRHTLYRALREAGLSVPQPCRRCRKPTLGDRRALYCGECRNIVRRADHCATEKVRYAARKARGEKDA